MSEPNFRYIEVMPQEENFKLRRRTQSFLYYFHTQQPLHGIFKIPRLSSLHILSNRGIPNEHVLVGLEVGGRLSNWVKKS